MDENIIDIANKIRENGGNLYLVGGAVRDKLLNIEFFDEDYCVTGINEQTFEQIFPEAKSIGKSFKVYQLYGKQFAMARKDIKKEAGHKGFEIIVGKDITIEEDLRKTRYND